MKETKMKRIHTELRYIKENEIGIHKYEYFFLKIR